MLNNSMTTALIFTCNICLSISHCRKAPTIGETFVWFGRQAVFVVPGVEKVDSLQQYLLGDVLTAVSRKHSAVHADRGCSTTGSWEYTYLCEVLLCLYTFLDRTLGCVDMLTYSTGV